MHDGPLNVTFKVLFNDLKSMKHESKMRASSSSLIISKRSSSSVRIVLLS